MARAFAYVMVMLLTGWLMVCLVTSHMLNPNPAMDTCVHSHVRITVLGKAPARLSGSGCRTFRCLLGGREITLETPSRKTAKCPMQLAANHTYYMDIIEFDDMSSILTRIYGEAK